VPEPTDLLERARQCYDRAAECRQAAAKTSDPVVRESYLSMASSYELLAVEAERTHRLRTGSLSAKPARH
jgi:hypothetical protein